MYKKLGVSRDQLVPKVGLDRYHTQYSHLDARGRAKLLWQQRVHTLREFGIAIRAIQSGCGDTLDVAIARRIVEELRGGVFKATGAALSDELEKALH